MKQQVRQKRWMWSDKQVVKWQVCVQVRSQATDTNTHININAKNGFFIDWLIQYNDMFKFKVFLYRYRRMRTEVEMNSDFRQVSIMLVNRKYNSSNNVFFFNMFHRNTTFLTWYHGVAMFLSLFVFCNIMYSCPLKWQGNVSTLMYGKRSLLWYQSTMLLA